MRRPLILMEQSAQISRRSNRAYGYCGSEFVSRRALELRLVEPGIALRVGLGGRGDARADELRWYV